MQIGWIIAVAGMAVLTITDIKEKKIPVATLILFGITAIIYRITEGGKWIDIVYSAITGVFLLMVSFCTKESIGYGDGWTVLILGLLVGVEGCLATVCMGLLFSACVSLILLVLHKVNGKSRLPF